MKRLLLFSVVACAFALASLPDPARADGAVPSPVYESWAPQGRTTLTAGIASTNVAAPTNGGNTAKICNRGAVDAYVNFGTSSSVVATVAGGYVVEAGLCHPYNLYPPNARTAFTYIAGITQSSTAVLYIETGSGSAINLPGSTGSTPGGAAGGDLAGTYPNPTVATLGAISGANLTALNASNLASGTVAAARGGAGTISGALKADGAGIVTQANCASLSDGGTSCAATIGTSGNTVPKNNTANVFSAAQGINLNATALPAAQTGTVLQAAQVDATSTRFELDSYGASAFYTTVRRSGTAALPTQCLAGEQIGGFNGSGLDNAATIRGPIASFRVYCGDNITSTAMGSIASIAAIPIGGTTLADQLTVYGSTGVGIGLASATTVPSAKLEVNGTVKGTSLALGGATIGTDALGVTGTATISGVTSLGNVNVTASTIPSNGIYLSGANTLSMATNGAIKLNLSSAGTLSNSTNSASWSLITGASSATVPTLVPNKSAATTGVGGDGTNLDEIVGGATIGVWSSTGVAVTGDVSGTTVTTSGTLTGVIRSNATLNNSNFGLLSGTSVSTTTTASLLLAGATTTTTRAIFRGSANGAIGAGNSYGAVIIGDQNVTEAASGTHPLLASLALRLPTITDGVATTTNATTLYIEGAPTGITPTNPATALWVAGGPSRFDGTVTATAFIPSSATIPSGVSITLPAANTVGVNVNGAQIAQFNTRGLSVGTTGAAGYAADIAGGNIRLSADNGLIQVMKSDATTGVGILGTCTGWGSTCTNTSGDMALAAYKKMYFYANGSTTAAFSIDTGSLLNLGTASSIANGSATVAFTALGPTGTTCVVGDWFKVLDGSGATRYIPMMTCT